MHCGSIMEIKDLKWCFKLRDGLQIVEPNDRLSKAYLEQAKSSLSRAEKDLKDNDLLWATVAIYYSEYYSLYSFLQKIGVKCENHTCSIRAVTYLLGEEKTKTINEHKVKRIDAQYYMKTDQEDKVKEMLMEAKLFVSQFDDIVSKTSDKEIVQYRSRMASAKN